MSLHALIIGATGLVGQELLRQLLKDPDFTRVTVLTRRPVGREDSKLVSLPLPQNWTETLRELPPIDCAFCCIGTTQKKAGSKAAFRAVDYDMPLALGKALKAVNGRHLLVISAMGASPRSLSFYSRVKGEMERDLSALGLEHLTIARPSLLLGDRHEARLAEDIGKAISPLLNYVLPGAFKAIQGCDVATALRKSAKAVQKEGVTILDSGQLLELAR